MYMKISSLLLNFCHFMKPNFFMFFRGESLFEEIQLIDHFSYEEVIKRGTRRGRDS